MRKFGCFFIQFQHRLFFGHLYALVSPCFIAYPRKKNKHLFFLSWQYCLSKEKLSTGHFFFAQSLPPFIPPERAVFYCRKGVLHPTGSRQFRLIIRKSTLMCTFLIKSHCLSPKERVFIYSFCCGTIVFRPALNSH